MKRRNLRTISRCMRVFAALLIMVPLALLLLGRYKPAMLELAANTINTRMDSVIEEIVQETAYGAGSYENLAYILRDTLDLEFREIEKLEISMPVGNIMGFGLFYGVGPSLKAKVAVKSRADVEYGSKNGSRDGSENNSKSGDSIKIHVETTFKGFFIEGSTQTIYTVEPEPVSDYESYSYSFTTSLEGIS